MCFLELSMVGYNCCNPISFSSRNNRDAKGFTFIELLIVISLIVIITTSALPAMTNTLINSRQNAHLITLMSYLQLTRSEAIVENKTVIMCKSRKQKQCDKNGIWSDGWIIFIDKDNNKQLNLEEKIINKHGKLIKSSAILHQSFSAGNNYVQFNPVGFSHTNGTFIFCHSQQLEKTKAIIISRTGRIRSEENPSQSSKKKCLPYIKSN